MSSERSQQDQIFLILRWTLIIATAYLILFQRPLRVAPPLVALFVAVYLASNLVVGILLPKVRSSRLFVLGVVLFDTLAVSFGILLAGSITSDFFLLYFVVMLFGALTDSLVSVVTSSVLVSLVQLYTMAHFLGWAELIHSGHLVRIPFLFVVGLFFGHLVQRAARAEREAETARTEQRTSKEFVAMLAHDIRNPLSAVLGCTELLEETPLAAEEDRRVLMDQIESSAQQAVTLAMNFVDSFRLETGSLQLRKEKTSLREIVEHALGSQRHAARTRGISIETALATDLPDLQLDKRTFDRVVVNLLSNAIKFSPEGGAIRVTTARRDDRVVLSVQDSGPGIPPEDRPKLFRRFSSLEGAKRESTGLGLYIVKTITEAHSGRVSVEYPPEGGTIFEVDLPLPRATSEASDRELPESTTHGR